MGKTFQAAFVMSGQVAPSFRQAITNASSAVLALDNRIKGLDKGKADMSRWRALKSELKTTGTEFAAAQAKVRELALALASTENPTKKMQREFEAARAKAGSLKDKLQAQSQELQHLRTSMHDAGISTRDLAGKQKELVASAEAARKAQSALQGVMAKRAALTQTRNQKRVELLDAWALGRTLMAPVAAAVQFESAMQGIARQVNGAKDAAGNFTPIYYQMGRSIQTLGHELPIATNEIADMVTAAARMNVPTEHLLTFTRLGAEMATAFEAPAGELTESMGKIANNFKIPVQNIRELADSINYLDDNAISKGSDIIGFLQRTSGVIASVKMSAKDAAALGSTLLSSGMTEETSGTAVNAIINRLAAADKGTRRLKRAFKELGLSTHDVQMGMQTDATGTIMKFIQAIQKLPSDKRIGAMVDIVGREHAPTLAKLVTNTEEYRRELELANGEAAKGSMAREMQTRMKGAAAQTQLFKNRVTELAVNLGTVLLPGLNALTGGLGGITSGLADFAAEHKTLTTFVSGTVAALLAFKIAAIGGGYAMTFVKGGYLAAQQVLLTLRAGLLAATGTTNVMTAAQTLLNVAMTANPIGLVVAGIAGLTVAGLALWKYWQPISAFFSGFWSGLVEGLRPAIQQFRALAPLFAPISSALSVVFGWLMKLLSPIKETAEGMTKIFNSGQGIGKAVGGAISGGVSWVGDKASKAWNFVKNPFGGAPKHGDGGTFARPHLAVVGDAPETIVPHARNARSLGLWAQAGAALGVGGGANGGISVSYSPQISINGNADAGTLGRALEMSEQRLRVMLKRIIANEKRLALA